MKTLGDIFGVKIEKDTVKKRPMRVEDIDCSSRLEKYFKEHNSKVRHGNNKMREDFEKLPEIIEYLKDAEWSELTQRYIAKRVNHYRAATFINGAYCAFQEQQKKIDSMLDRVCGKYEDFK